MIPCAWLFVIVVLCRERCGALQPRQSRRPGAAPNITTCEEFEWKASFNPYHVLDSVWKIFYFWADNTELTPIVFSLPDKRRLVKFKEQIETIEPVLSAIEWNKAALFMNPKFGTEVLFISASTPGAYRAVIKIEQRKKNVRPFPPPWIKLADVRLKIVRGVLGMMCCEDFTAYAMARMDRMPETEAECLSEAKLLGFYRSNGQSYLTLRKKIQDEL